VPLDPEQINLAGLPRDALGGYKAAPAEELLKRIAWDYRQLVHERDTLKETAGVLRLRVDELEAQFAELQDRLEGQRDPDEIGRTLLAAAQRMARELRESARGDSDTTLKKARARARSIEAEAQRRSDAAVRAQRLGADVRRQLQATLDILLEGALAKTAGDTLDDVSARDHNPGHLATAD
jgi:cell division septum initiation protein DivIVA